MFHDVSFIGPWLLLVFILGLGVGWVTERTGPQEPWFEGWLRGAAIAFAVGLILVWLQAFPGRFGYWLETAVINFAVYIFGCLMGGVLRRVYAPLTPPVRNLVPRVPATDKLSAMG